MRRALFRLLLLFEALSIVAACGSSGAGTTAPPPPPCDDECKDGIAILAIRETAKLAYNLTLQGKPVGDQDVRRSCPFGGTVHVFGNATSNAVQGATEVKLTYEFADCAYTRQDNDPKHSYEIRKLTGTMTQEGILAVQPSATSAITMRSESLTFEGTVYDPPIDYTAAACPVELGQSGNNLDGKICGRAAKGEL